MVIGFVMQTGGARTVDFFNFNRPQFYRRPVEHDLTARKTDDSVGETARKFKLMQADDRSDPIRPAYFAK